jgi:hypothetical protein
VQHLLRFDVAAHVTRLSRSHEGARAADALVAVYRGEKVVSIGLGGLESVRDEPARALVREAGLLVRPWSDEARIELRSLRRPVRRLALGWLGDVDELALVAAGRRKLVLVPAGTGRDPVLAQLNPNRRRMARLAARDGEHCVWCSTPLTHESPRATIDHVRCRSEGGADAIDNLVLACASCNNGRANVEAETWLQVCLADGRAVDEVAVRAAIRRSQLHHDEVRRAA